MENFKTIISTRRKELKMTQKELAEKLNISDRTVSKWETGSSYPDSTILKSLAKVLEINIINLLEASEMNEKDIIKTENESYDYDRINRFRNNIIICIGLFVLSIITLIIGKEAEDDVVVKLLIVFSCIGLISSLTFLFITINNYRSFYINKFYRQKYDISFYNIATLALQIMTISFIVLANTIGLASYISLLLLIMHIVVQFVLAYKSNIKIKLDYINIILFIIPILLPIIILLYAFMYLLVLSVIISYLSYSVAVRRYRYISK